MKDSKKDSSGDDGQVTVEIHFHEPDLVYTISYDGGVPAQVAFDESVKKGICEFFAATGISKEKFLSHPEANLDGKTVAEWAASTNSVPRVILTTKPKDGLLAKLQWRTNEARKVMGAREEVVKNKALAMAQAVLTTPKQNDEEMEQLMREKKQVEKQLQATEEQPLVTEQRLKKKMAAEEEEVEACARLVKQKEEEVEEEELYDQLVNHNTSLEKQLFETNEELKTKEKLLQELLDKQRKLVEEEVTKQAQVFQRELESMRAGYEAEKLRLEKKLEEIPAIPFHCNGLT